MKQLFFLLSILVSVLDGVNAYGQTISTLIEKKSKEILPKLVEWRRHIHQNPELSNREFKTAEYVANHLRSLGIPARTGVAKTGVVGILKGAKPGPVIALRADMDALPVEEKTNLPYASRVRSEYLGETVPVMHACGHDAHVAILMATAQVLSQMKNEIAGTVVFVFQPAEEGPPASEQGGAELMVKEGALTDPKVDAIVGLHISSTMDNGEVGYKAGPFMASSDWFTIRINGKQAHGASPWNSIDPVVIGSQIVNSLQTIVSRQENILKAPVVITVAKFHAGVRPNIIPEQAILEGTIRTLDAEMQKNVHERIRRTATNIAEAAGATATVDISSKTLVTVNDTSLVRAIVPSLKTAAGAVNVSELPWTTAAEDFSYYGTKVPAAFIYLGARDPKLEKSEAPGHHTPEFVIDETKLDVGVRVFCQIVMDFPKSFQPKKN
jgi:amidohydrolase